MWTWERGWDLTGYIDWSVCVENYERPSYIHTYIEEHRSLRMHAWEIKNARYDGEGDVCWCVPSWETDLKKKIACVRWIMPTGSVCACMHERNLVVLIKRRLLCGYKRIGEVIINVKLNSNIWIRDPDVWNPCMHEYNGDLRGVVWKRACCNVYTLNKVRLIWIWDTDGRHHLATSHPCMDTLF